MPDRDRMRWLMLAVAFVGRVAVGFQFQTVGSLAPRLAADLGLTYAELGTLIGLYLLPGLLVAAPAGYIGSKVNERLLVAAGLAGVAAGGIIAAASDSFWGLAVGRLVCGVGFVVANLFFAKMIADWFTGRELATAMAILVMSWPFGIAMGQVFHSWVAINASWQTAFWTATLYAGAGALLVLFGYRSPPGAAAATAPQARLEPREWVLVLLASGVWAFFNAGYIVYLSFAPRLLVAHGFEELAAAATISVASWLMLVSGAACGAIVDRTKRSDLAVYLCLTVGAASIAALPLTSLALGLSLAFGLVGMAPAGVIMALTGEAVAKERRAFGMGIFFTNFFLIMAPAPALAGWLFDRAQDAYAPILLAAALFVAAMICNWGFRLAQRRLIW